MAKKVDTRDPKAEAVSRRARADHAAAAIEALHGALEMLGRAAYHLTATELQSPATEKIVTATRCAVEAHALMRILADRIPSP